jgi:hypothetical protein
VSFDCCDIGRRMQLLTERPASLHASQAIASSLLALTLDMPSPSLRSACSVRQPTQTVCAMTTATSTACWQCQEPQTRHPSGDACRRHPASSLTACPTPAHSAPSMQQQPLAPAAPGSICKPVCNIQLRAHTTKHTQQHASATHTVNNHRSHSNKEATCNQQKQCSLSTN